MAGFNISLSLNERQSGKKHNKSLRLVLFIPFRFVSPALYRFPLSTAKQTKLFHSISEMFFTFLARKTLWVKLFSLNVCEAALQAAIKGGNIGAKLTHFCGFWLDVSFFSHVKKHRSRFWLDLSFFFTCENHRSLLWLARTNLRTKIYDIAFWWVFLSMYIIKLFPYCIFAFLNFWSIWLYFLLWQQTTRRRFQSHWPVSRLPLSWAAPTAFWEAINERFHGEA